MAEFTQYPILTEMFHQALYWASKVHFLQVRKGKNKEPYIAHLLAVCSIVLENGGNEKEAIAALLHDAIEDIENITRRDILAPFGEDVANIVCELSEDKTLDKYARKIAYAESVLTMSDSAVKVSFADKLHNLRCYMKAPELFGYVQQDFYKVLLPNFKERLGEETVHEMYELFDKLISA